MKKLKLFLQKIVKAVEESRRRAARKRLAMFLSQNPDFRDMGPAEIERRIATGRS